MVMSLPSSAVAATQLFNVHLTAQGNETDVSVDLGAPMPFHARLDPAGRVVVEFATATMRPNQTVSRGVGLISTFHAESMSPAGVRLVLELAHPAVISAVDAAPKSGSKPARAVIELVASSAEKMRASANAAHNIVQPPDAIAGLIDPAPPSSGRDPFAAAPKAPREAQPMPLAPAEKAPVMAVASVVAPVSTGKKSASIASIISPKRTIVIDAGHGGIDPGAESIAGYHEKEITLATARLLRRALEDTGRYKVVMTRDSDTYLKLHERVTRARAAHGDLFISLHADSVANAADRTARGASIYTLSETASDAESERYAQRENRADAIGGVDLGDQSDDVAGILVDLTVRESVNDGNRLAGMMADAFEHRGVSLLPNAPHRSAGFAVLKAPDIPSILIEMGYLSDIADARSLADPRHQAQIASAIVDGVDRYFAWLQVSRS